MAINESTLSITRRGFVAAAAAMVGGIALGDVPGAGAEQASSQVVVVINPGSEPAAGFDPFHSWGCGEHVHEPLIQSTLVTTDLDLNVRGDLATSFECAPDCMSWTFNIRDDVKFTDGEPLTARDVAFTINGVINSDSCQADLSMVDCAEVVDDYTVVLKMNKPFNALLYTLAVVGIVPEHAYSESYGYAPVGSGRYMLEQWDQGQQAILVANPDYYGDPVKMQRVVILFMAEDAALAAAQSGQADVSYTSQVYSDIQIGGYGLLACSTVDSRGVSLPTVPREGTKGEEGYVLGNDVTCDVAVRRAMNYGTDRRRMIDNVLNGYGTPAYSVGDGLPWSSEDMRCDYDPELAAGILAEAGWKPGADGILEKDGLRCSVELWYSASDSVRQAIAAEWSNQMRELGIEVNINGASWDEIYTHQYSDLVEWGWGSNAPIEMYELNYSTGWGNYATYESESIDSYLDAALACPTLEESYDLWKKAQWDGADGPAPQGGATWVWFANIDHLYFVREGLQVAAQKPHPHGHGWSLLNNVDQWSW